MKKIFSLIALLVLVNLTNAQKSFEKSRIVAGVNWDIGVYKTESYLNSFPSFKDDDGAVSNILSIWGEYGLTNWLGIGLKIARSNYISEKDSLTGILPSAGSNDFGLQFSFHPLKTKKFDLPIILVIGSSSFKRESNEVNNVITSDVGNFYNIAINPRFFFGEKARFGINVKVGLAGYNYESMDIEDKFNSLKSVYTLKGSGANMMFGFQYNFK